VSRPESLEITDPKAVRYLGDAQKRRIISEFVDEPRTALDVARRLDIRPQTMYHHINQLLEAGLLVVVRTQQKRGTVERFLQTPAKLLVGRAHLGASSEAMEIFSNAFSAALRDIEAAKSGGLGLSFTEVRIRADQVQETIEAARHAAEAGPSDEKGDLVRVMIAAYPASEPAEPDLS